MSLPEKERDTAEVRAARLAPAEHLQRAPARFYEDKDYVDLGPYIRALREQWRTIAKVTVPAAIVTALLTSFVLPRWYRASAVIRPISTPAVESRMLGALGGLGGGLSGLGNIAASLGAGGGNNDAEEYIAILRGFGFNIALAKRYHLRHELLKHRILSFLNNLTKSSDRDWAVYRVLKKRFDCDYSFKTGNITLYFEARNRRDAEKILGYYIEDLRGLLRAREIRDTSAAIESLEAEAKATPDDLLRTQLYDLVAKQVERKKTAQVEADFAFRVLDPPAAPDRRYSPSVPLDTAVVALLALLGMSLRIGLKQRNSRPNY